MGAVYDPKVPAEARKLAAEHLDNALLTNPPKLNVGMTPRAGKSVLAGRVHGGGERVGPIDKVWVDELFERKDDPHYTLYCGVDMASTVPFKDATAVVLARKVPGLGMIEVRAIHLVGPGAWNYCRWRRRIRFLMQARPVRRSQRRAGPAHPWRWPGSRAKR